MKMNGVAIEAVEVARIKAAASLSKTASFSTPRRRISHEERQAQIRTLIELEELMNLENLSTGMRQHQRPSSRSMRQHHRSSGSSSSVRNKPSQDWESRSVSSAPNLASSYHRPRVVDISRAVSSSSSASPFDDGGSIAGFSFRSEGKVTRGGSSRRSGYDDDDMSSVGLRSVNSDSRKNSKHRRSALAKALFGSRKKKTSASTSTTKSTSDYDDDRSTATSKSRKLFSFTRRNSTETADATSVVSDGSLQTRKRRGLFGLGGGKGRSTDAGDDKSVHSYNSASGSVNSMMRRIRRGQAAASKKLNDDDEDEERSLDSVSAISTNTQSSEKSSRNKFNIFRFISRQKKAKKAIQNFEELPTFLIPDRVAIPEPEAPTPASWQEQKKAAASVVVSSSVKSVAPTVTEAPPAPVVLPTLQKRELYVRGADGAVEVQVQVDAMARQVEAMAAARPPLPDKKKKKKRSSSISSSASSVTSSASSKAKLPSAKESREILFDCHEETKTIDGEDDDGSVFTILSGIIAAWASETAAKKARDPKSRSKSGTYFGGEHVKSCLKAENPPKPRYSVTFGVISIREYERTVGDNPSVTSGPPISIGWSYMPSFEAGVDEYETSRPCRRTKREFYLPSDLRKELLLNEWGYTVEEVRRAKREATYIQYHREKSAYQGLLSEKAQELAESTRRKVNRLRNGNNTKKEQEKLWDQAQERLGVLTKPPPTTVLVSPTDGMDEEM